MNSVFAALDTIDSKVVNRSRNATSESARKLIICCYTKTTNVSYSHQSVNRKVDIFRIIPIKLYHNERCIRTFAYLDDGSNVTTIENDLANELNLEGAANENLCIKCSFGKIRKIELVSRRVSVGISGVQTNASVYQPHNVRTVTDLALPCQTMTLEWLN